MSQPISSTTIPQTSASSSRKRSAAEALSSKIVQFPPAAVSDFVIHYRGTAFHVHKFVLIYHSYYFRAYIEQLVDGERSHSADECDEHLRIAHCNRLPDSCGKVEASVERFRLFLCHLYFARHYRCLPYETTSAIDLNAEPRPAVTLDWPSFDSFEQLEQASTATFLDKRSKAYRSVLSLCHYFDCAALLSRAEDNMLLMVRAYTAATAARGTRGTLCPYQWSLEVADQFGLERVKTECIPLQAARFRNKRRTAGKSQEWWQLAMQQLSKDTVIELVRAIRSCEV